MKMLDKFLNSYKFYITTTLVVLMCLTTLVIVGFGALNQNLNIAGDVEYSQDVGNMIKQYTTSTTTDFHNSTYKEKIISVDFLDNKNVPASAIGSWDVSVNNDGKVMAWIIDDSDNEGYYKLYIGANGDVVGNTISSYLFYGLKYCKTVSFNNNFDTSKVTNMSYMFKVDSGSTSRLYNINGLNNFITSNVTDMGGMFYGCSRLTTIELSNFNTSNVTNMTDMFRFCQNLTSLDVSHFNTSNVTSMAGMFNNCISLTSLNLSNFDTSKVKGNITSDYNQSAYAVTGFCQMFCDCRGLTSLDLASFNTSEAVNMTSMFSGCTNLVVLNLSSFNTVNVGAMNKSFSNQA